MAKSKAVEIISLIELLMIALLCSSAAISVRKVHHRWTNLQDFYDDGWQDWQPSSPALGVDLPSKINQDLGPLDDFVTGSGVWSVNSFGFFMKGLDFQILSKGIITEGTANLTAKFYCPAVEENGMLFPPVIYVYPCKETENETESCYIIGTGSLEWTTQEIGIDTNSSLESGIMLFTISTDSPCLLDYVSLSYEVKEEVTTTTAPTTTTTTTTTQRTTTPTTTIPTTTGPSTTTCRPRTDIPEFDPNNPSIIVRPGEDGDCGIPPITLPIQPGNKINISVTFLLEQHPLDVYYLMDFSGSMGDDKTNLVRLSSALVSTLENLTSNFNLGFGAFVDKPIYPLGSSGDYSVKNRMRLTNQYSSFSSSISATRILSGGDGPESAGDALAQVALCNERIGWRSNTRKVVILATDANHHVAGDGRVARITTPFEPNCRLNAAGDDPDQLKFDYASIDQLVNIVNDRGITVIYAVTAYARSFYQSIANQMRSAAVGILSSDSSNIIDLVKNVYRTLENRVELEHDDGDNITKEIKIRYYSSCGENVPPEEKTVCETMKENGEINFLVEVDLSQCPRDPKDWKQTLKLQPVGLPLVVEIEFDLICK